MLNSHNETCFICYPVPETYFFRNSQTFASGFNLNSQIAVSYSQLVLLLFQIDSLNHEYLLICCLQIGNDKNAK